MAGEAGASGLTRGNRPNPVSKASSSKILIEWPGCTSRLSRFNPARLAARVMPHCASTTPCMAHGQSQIHFAQTHPAVPSNPARRPSIRPLPTSDFGLWTLDFGRGAGADRHGQRGQVRAPSSGSEPRPTQNRKRTRTPPSSNSSLRFDLAKVPIAPLSRSPSTRLTVAI